jgi:hypothetical protein
MDEIPHDLLAALLAAARATAETWWAGLSDGERRQIAGLWDKRLEVRFFEPQADESGRVDDWDHIPKVRRGRYEHATRTFHVGCTVHAAARSCLTNGAVPAGFACPVSRANRPLLPLRGCRLSPPA